jgi:hypothetical protein
MLETFVVIFSFNCMMCPYHVSLSLCQCTFKVLFLFLHLIVSASLVIHKEACYSRVAYFQDTALTNGSLSTAQKYNLHAVVASLLVLIPNVVPISPLMEYAEKVSSIFLITWI